jgi:hypothetical protein
VDHFVGFLVALLHYHEVVVETVLLELCLLQALLVLDLDEEVLEVVRAVFLLRVHWLLLILCLCSRVSWLLLLLLDWLLSLLPFDNHLGSLGSIGRRHLVL